jgi:DNA repair protein RadC
MSSASTRSDPIERPLTRRDETDGLTPAHKALIASLGIPVLDHLIIGGGGRYASFADHGEL